MVKAGKKVKGASKVSWCRKPMLRHAGRVSKWVGLHLRVILIEGAVKQRTMRGQWTEWEGCDGTHPQRGTGQ